MASPNFFIALLDTASDPRAFVGPGVFVLQDLILTAKHVLDRHSIREGDVVAVRTLDGEMSATADVIHTNTDADFALLVARNTGEYGISRAIAVDLDPSLIRWICLYLPPEADTLLHGDLVTQLQVPSARGQGSVEVHVLNANVTEFDANHYSGGPITKLGGMPQLVGILLEQIWVSSPPAAQAGRSELPSRQLYALCLREVITRHPELFARYAEAEEHRILTLEQVTHDLDDASAAGLLPPRVIDYIRQLLGPSS